MLHIFYLYDVVVNRNIRICMVSHYHKIEKKTLFERIRRFSIVANSCDVIVILSIAAVESPVLNR